MLWIMQMRFYRKLLDKNLGESWKGHVLMGYPSKGNSGTFTLNFKV